MNKLVGLTLAGLASASAMTWAEEAPRLSGEIMFSSAYLSSNSQLHTRGDSQLNNLNSHASQHDEWLIVPLGNITYELGDSRRQRVYLGTSNDDLAIGNLAFELGYQYDFDNGTQIDVSLLPTVVSGEKWANPYQESGMRSKQDVSGIAYRMQLHNLVNTGLTLDMAYANAEYDNDQVQHQSLLRDHDLYYIKASYPLMSCAQSSLVAAIAYTHKDAKGKAQSYDQYKAELSYYWLKNAHSLAVTGGIEQRDYDAIHPIFERTREDKQYSLFVAYQYANVFGWDNWNLVSFNGVKANDSNINFYEKQEYLTSIGLSYNF
ncbi:DUF2860 family protein [Motilimonas pumila]|uniref:DUF2860 domain-containing protein n=1 Tax=Motilimonas pumila TaxID=2303987 RepID=A0A418YEE9_9GAMM|nr:DUF2860 family protein [Motilimonas pumila]RJG47536.1 DUF2860 domain-containing protein [Motilimonas pumila]